MRGEIVDPLMLILFEVLARRRARSRKTIIIASYTKTEDMDDSAHRVRRQFNSAHEPDAASLALRLSFVVAGCRVVIGQRYYFDARIGDDIDKSGRREFAVAMVAVEMEVCDQVDEFKPTSRVGRP